MPTTVKDQLTSVNELIKKLQELSTKLAQELEDELDSSAISRSALEDDIETEMAEALTALRGPRTSLPSIPVAG